MRTLIPAILAVLLGASAAVVVGCGDSNGLIPAQNASRIESGLDAIAAGADSRVCKRATDAYDRTKRAVRELPRSVDPVIRNGLSSKLDDLNQRALNECSIPKSTASTATTAPTTTTDTTATTDTTPTTDTAPTDTTPTVPTTDTTPTAPPDTTPAPPPGGTQPDNGGTSAGGTRQREGGK